MKRFKAQKTYFALVMLILGVLFIAGCPGGDEVSALLASFDNVTPGTCTAVGPKVTSSTPTGTGVSMATPDITAVFDAGRHPDQIFRNTHQRFFFRIIVSADGTGRVDHQRFGISDVGQILRQLEAVDDFKGGCFIAGSESQ